VFVSVSEAFPHLVILHDVGGSDVKVDLHMIAVVIADNPETL